MRALVVTPSTKAAARVASGHPEPVRKLDELLVESLLVGVCGTDREIVGGQYGEPPAGQRELVLGHESLGRVVEADAESGFRSGDLVVGIVRRPDPEPCACCAAGEWDMCLNGKFTERGINGAHGYASERFTLERDFAIKVPESLGDLGVLLEPASVVAKAWEQVGRVLVRCSSYRPRHVLITGAGPVGLLAALLAVQLGYKVDVLDLLTEGLKPQLVRSLGARYVTGSVSQLDRAPELVVECTGSDALIVELLARTARNSIVCLAGVSSGARKVMFSASAFNNAVVLENDLIFGTVNANRRHYAQALSALCQADPTWLSRLITRRVPLSRYRDAFERRADDVKVVIDMRA